MFTFVKNTYWSTSESNASISLSLDFGNLNQFEHLYNIMEKIIVTLWITFGIYLMVLLSIMADLWRRKEPNKKC